MNNIPNKLIIAIDGYSSSGKSTFAKGIAKRLNYRYIDSGAMYRAVTLFCIKNDLIKKGIVNHKKVSELLDSIEISFKYNSRLNINETYLNKRNVENEIRSLEVSENVSIISKIKMVREKLVNIQQKMGEKKGVVVEGRDIGTVVFPRADIKIFLTAKVDIRSERRYIELTEKGVHVNFEEIKKNITQRDFIDETRKESPLKKADDALVLDNSNMTPDEQIDWVIALIKSKCK